MNKKLKFAVIWLLLIGVAVGVAIMLHGHSIAVLNPKGIIAQKEFDLMLTATFLMLLVVIPVFVLTFVIAWKFRAANTHANYRPDWDHSRAAETTWWAIPFLLIFVISIMTWRSSHDLDPFKPIASSQPPITVQVVALQWKWLFIYPDQHIASVNYVQFPVNTPVNFVITSDAPMNSFWIPQLGGQIYAMPGMSTRLSLMASEIGSYSGSSANLSGPGFAGMKFVAKASTRADFDSWVAATAQSPDSLTREQYDTLAKPSQNNPITTYSHPGASLYDGVVTKYMMP